MTITPISTILTATPSATLTNTPTPTATPTYPCIIVTPTNTPEGGPTPTPESPLLTPVTPTPTQPICWTVTPTPTPRKDRTPQPSETPTLPAPTPTTPVTLATVIPPALLPVTGDRPTVDGRGADVAAAVGGLSAVRGWLGIDGRVISLDSDTTTRVFTKSLRRSAMATIGAQGEVRLTWNYDTLRQWPQPAAGEALSLAIGDQRATYRVRLVDVVPANWEVLALNGVGRDDLVIVVSAGATRLIIWAMPVERT